MGKGTQAWLASYWPCRVTHCCAFLQNVSEVEGGITLRFKDCILGLVVGLMSPSCDNRAAS